MQRYRDYIEKLRSTDSLRTLRDTQTVGTDIFYNEKLLKNFSSNDYLGIGGGDLWQEFLKTDDAKEHGGSCSSRLLTGNNPPYKVFEKNLANSYGSESALVFNSGYHANLGILPALTTSKDLILADKLVHASLIDGIRLSSAETIRFRHNDMAQLEKILEERRSDYENVFIATEAVFSMDGDTAPLEKLVELKKKYKAFLYVDEAHSVGTRGETGLGLAEECNVLKDIDLQVGTLGKSFASQGAYLICNDIFKNYLINTMRPLIFSTALPPISVAWSNYVFSKIGSMSDERKNLRKISDYLREGMIKMGFETAGESNIVPLIVRDNAKAVELSKKCIKNGFFVLPIRTPTVAAGSGRLRISLTAAHTIEDIDKFLEICRHFGR